MKLLEFSLKQKSYMVVDLHAIGLLRYTLLYKPTRFHTRTFYIFLAIHKKWKSSVTEILCMLYLNAYAGRFLLLKGYA
jgi:hypothetical protein